MNVVSSLVSEFGRFLRGRWSQALFSTLLIGGLLWYYLPLLSFFLPVWHRVPLVMLVALIAFGLAWWYGRRDKARERALNATVTDSRDGEAREAQAATEEVRVLRRRLAEAIGVLRKRGVRRLYDLPWYILIGPPGSGKTTLLRHSGLHFPLTNDNEDTIHGVGGTRLCDWWFADEAVLIDTAGRYTTQDSNRAVDRAGWLGFLDALRRARPRAPINGVVVMLSLLDMIGDTPEGCRVHARQVRQRINELTERLGQRMPVYLVCNKFDRLTGFEAFFDDLDGANRAQVWGMTFAQDHGQEDFRSEFSGLLDRLEARVYDRLQTERALDRRALIAGFPLQVGSLAEPLDAFLSEAFRGSKLDPAPMLRGVYFTSATQVGAPFDRLSGALSRSFGIDQKRGGAVRNERGRAYFVQRLVRDVILGESLLGACPPKVYRRRRAVRLAALCGVAAVGIGGLMLVWQADRQARAMNDRQMARFSAYHDVVAPIAGRSVTNDDDLPVLCDALDQAAALGRIDGGGLAVALRLAPHEAAEAAGRSAYEDALRRLLYPRLIWRLEHDIQARFDDPAFLYDAVRVYLLLGGLGPHEPQIVQAWFDDDWSRRYAGSLNTGLRARLDRHLGALLALPASDLGAGASLDGGLVRRARIAFGHVTPAQRIYGRLRDMASAPGAMGSDVAAWSPKSALGAVADTVFARRSGAPMTEEVPAFYTGPGFAVVMRRDLPGAAHAVANESWVLGHDADLAVQGGDASSLEEQVAALWEQDARTRWTATLNDLTLRLGTEPGQVANSLYLLSSPQSPLRDILRSIVAAQMIPEPVAKAGHTAAAAPVDQVEQRWNASWAALAEVLHPTGGGTPPIDGIVGLIGELDTALASSGQSPGTRAMALDLPDPAQRLRAEASRQSEPLATWLREIADRGDTVRGQAQRIAASDAFNGPGGPGATCRALTKGRYPFDPDAMQDASLSDFVRVFAPGGLLDRYAQDAVLPYVDTTTQPWRMRAQGGGHPSFSAVALAAFARADVIRHAFFPAGGAPFLGLSLTLHADEDTQLLLGGVSVHPQTAVALTWPGSDGFSPARIVRMRDGRQTELAHAEGQWGLFRLLGQGLPQGGGAMLYPDGETITVRRDDGSALKLSVLAGFTCPVVP